MARVTGCARIPDEEVTVFMGVRRMAIRGSGIVAVLLAAGLLNVTSTKVDPASSPSEQAKAAFAQFTDLPIPEGAEMDLEKTLILGSQESWIGRLVLETGQSAPELFDFYQLEMTRFGWSEVTAVRADISVLTYQPVD